MKNFKLGLIILLISNTINANNINPENEHQIKENGLFLLLMVDKNNQYKLAKIQLNNLKKCIFPKGPFRYNSIDNFNLINSDEWNKIEKNPHTKMLSSFCIESEQENQKNCAFQLPNNQDLVYLFNVSSDIKEFKACITSNDDLIFSEDYDPSADIDSITKHLDLSHLEREDEEPPSKFQIQCQQVAVSLLLKYISLKQGISNSYDKICRFFKRSV